MKFTEYSPNPVGGRRGQTRFAKGQAARPASLRARIESVGAYVPARRVTSQQVVSCCARGRAIDLEAMTGIRERAVCAPGEDSLTLSVSAARDCLAHSRHRAEDLELLIYCGITKYDEGLHHLRFEPSFGLLVREALGASRAMPFDLANACAGMLTGVHVLNDFVRRGAIRCGMVVSGEFISHLSTNASRKVDGARHPQGASLTLGDAGAAVIVERAEGDEPGLAASVFTTHAEHVDLCTGGPCPDGPGGQMLTQSREIQRVGIEGTPAIVERALETAGLTFEAIDHVIMHQTSVRAIEKCRALVHGLLGSERADWVVHVDRVGNTASTSHFVALRHCLDARRFESGARVMLIAQASGLVLGTLIFTMDGLRDRYGRSD